MMDHQHSKKLAKLQEWVSESSVLPLSTHESEVFSESLIMKIIAAGNRDDLVDHDLVEERINQDRTTVTGQAIPNPLAFRDPSPASIKRPLSPSSGHQDSDSAIMKIVAARSHELQGQDAPDHSAPETDTATPPSQDDTSLAPGAYFWEPRTSSITRNELPRCVASMHRKAADNRRPVQLLSDPSPATELAPATSLSNMSLCGRQTDENEPTTDSVEAGHCLGLEDAERGKQREEIVRRSPFRTRLILASSIGIIALVTIVLIVHCMGPSTSHGNRDAQFASHDEAVKALLNSLPFSTIQALIKDQAALLPPIAAFEWVAGDPMLSQYPLWRIQQRFAVATLYFALQRSSPPPSVEEISYALSECEWTLPGALQQCEYSTDVIQGLELQDAATLDQLPTEIVILSSLHTLLLNNPGVSANTSLSTFLPKEMASLSQLKRLEIAYQDDTAPFQPGPIPSLVGSLTQLTALTLSGLQLTGTIPTELSQLTPLESLILSNNALSGPIAGDLLQLPQLQTLWLQENQLSGALPVPRTPTKLSSINLRHNKLVGTLPVEWGSSMTNVMEVRLAFNTELRGTIPVEWGNNMSTLQTLDLNGMPYLSGTVPQGFCGRPSRDRMVFFVDCDLVICCSRLG